MKSLLPLLLFVIMTSPLLALTDGDYEYRFINNGTHAEITAYNGHASDLTIPNFLGDHLVTSIGSGAFSGTSISTLTLTNHITTIGNSAFANCISLSSVNFKNNLTSIGDSAFSFCISLTIVTLPRSLTSIGSLAFSDCISLLAVRYDVLDPNITPADTFTNNINDKKPIIYYFSTLGTLPDPWNGLTTIDYESAPIVDDDFIYNVRFNDGNPFVEITKYIGTDHDLTITTLSGYPVKVIARESFRGTNSLRTVFLSNTITKVSGLAFAGCSNLTSVRFSAALTNLGVSSFLYCPNLQSAILSGTLLERIAPATFAGCSALEVVTLPSSIQKIDDTAFRECTSLHSIDLPDSTNFIGSQAFEGCTSLQSIDMPDSISVIGYDAFAGCTSLQSIVLPDSLTTIYSDTFRDCTSLTTIVFPELLTTIDPDYPFANCHSLESVYYLGDPSITPVQTYSRSNSPTNQLTIYYLGSKGSLSDPFDGYPTIDMEVAGIDPTPTLSSITLESGISNLTTAGQVSFDITFATDVIGVDISDFTITYDGQAMGTASLTGDDNQDTFVLTIPDLVGNSDLLTVGLSDDSFITSQRGFQVVDSPITASVTIDNTAPARTTFLTTQTPTPSSADSLTYTISFSEPVFGLDEPSDIWAAGNNDPSISLDWDATFITHDGGNQNYLIILNGFEGDGNFQFQIRAGQVKDAAGNQLTSFPTSGPFTFDNTAPDVAITAETTSASSASFLVTFSEGTSTPVIADFAPSAPSGSPTLAISYVSGFTFQVTLSNLTGEGPVTLAFAPDNSIADGAGNLLGPNPASDSIILGTISPFETWADSYFPGETDPAIIGETANPSGDGLSNLVKFAFNLDPTTTNLNKLKILGENSYAPGLPISFLSEDGNTFTARYLRLKSHEESGLTYTVEFSNSLDGWEAGDAGTVIHDDGGDYEVVEVTRPLTIDGTIASFLRVGVASQ